MQDPPTEISRDLANSRSRREGHGREEGQWVDLKRQQELELSGAWRKEPSE